MEISSNKEFGIDVGIGVAAGVGVTVGVIVGVGVVVSVSVTAGIDVAVGSGVKVGSGVAVTTISFITTTVVGFISVPSPHASNESRIIDIPSSRFNIIENYIIRGNAYLSNRGIPPKATDSSCPM